MNFTDKVFRAQAVDNLDTARRILDDLKIPYFLSNGTLLGCIRDGDLIKHDTDVDLGVFCEDIRGKEDLLRQKFLDKGFHVFGEYGTIEDGFEFSFKRINKLDIFIYYKEGDKRTMSVYTSNGRLKYVYDDFHTIPYTFLGEPVYVPDNYESYLIAQYGDWKTPVEVWHYARDPKNIQNGQH